MDSGKENGNYYHGVVSGFGFWVYWGYIGILEENTETTRKRHNIYIYICRGYMRIMEKEKEANYYLGV